MLNVRVAFKEEKKITLQNSLNDGLQEVTQREFYMTFSVRVLLLLRI